jgi:arsenite methyltransferase
MDETKSQEVQFRYGNIAKRSHAADTPRNSEEKIAMAFGYSAKDLYSLPEKANMGLSCGNPVKYADIKAVSEPQIIYTGYL